MDMAKIINMFAIILVIIGAINWGLIAINGFDLVTFITPDYPQIERLIKLIVGIAGIYFAYIISMPTILGKKTTPAPTPTTTTIIKPAETSTIAASSVKSS
jgi:uncharacterized membrane protein YuzA (DUF378 family)